MSALICFSLFACGNTVSLDEIAFNVRLSEDKSEYTVTGIGGFDEEVLEIPASIDSIPVTGIADGAFARANMIKSVVLPSSVTSIGATAFLQCKGLEKLEIKGGQTVIGERAFMGCSNLKTVLLPNSIKEVRGNAFVDCPSIEGTAVDSAVYLGNSSNPYVMLYKIDDSTIEEYTVQDGCRILYSYAFQKFENLVTVNFASTVVYIGENCFLDCVLLTNVVLDSVEVIDSKAFYGCKNLTYITFGKSLKKVGDYAFYGGCKLSKVFYKGTEEDRAQIQIYADYNSVLNIDDANSRYAKWEYIE